MPSLNSNKTHQFTDIYEAKPFPITIIYFNCLRFPLRPHKNGWAILYPTTTGNLTKSRQKYTPNNWEIMLFQTAYNVY